PSFGGSSVATAERIMRAARRAIRARQAGNQVIVVVSARGDTTDELIELAREITDRPPAREMDMLLSTGEQISIALMAMAIESLGQPAISFTGAQIGIVTDSFHTTDPRIVPEARKLDVISYDEILELASLGANVLHSRSVEFAKKFDVPLQKRSSFSDAEGTRIVPEADWMRAAPVVGCAIV